MSGSCNARFVSRAFDGGRPERKKVFVRAFTALLSNALNGSAPVNATADFRSADTELGTTVTHLTNVFMYGSVAKLCVLGRVCRELALDILFKAGVVRLRALTVQSRPRGR